MNFKELINASPTTLTILPTHKCNAACKECCFGCNPKIKHIMSVPKIQEHIDTAMKAFPSIKVIVFSGGECFLLGKKLIDVIEYAHKYNTIVRVVTNGFWANTYDNAYEVMKKLHAAGLNEINFSTGDDHLQFVRFDNIVNGTLAAYDVGIRSIVISVETPLNAKFTSCDIRNNAKLHPLLENGSLKYINASWMNVKKNSNKQTEIFFIRDKPRPCSYLYHNISINPYSQLLACCGLTVEYNQYLKLGDLEQYNIEYLYNKQYEDLYKLWLYVSGPEKIYELLTKRKGVERKFFPHDCAYCIEIVKDKDNIPLIKKLLQENLSNILYWHQIKQTSFKIDFTT